MPDRRRRISSAHVMSGVALFVSLGGGAYALSLRAGSVGTKQLHDGAVTGAKVRNGALTETKLRNGAVTGAKVRDGSLTGADLRASTLGKVQSAARADAATNATQLGGLPPSAYLHKDATVVAGNGSAQGGAGAGGGAAVPFLTIAGFGTVNLACLATVGALIPAARFTNTSGQAITQIAQFANKGSGPVVQGRTIAAGAMDDNLGLNDFISPQLVHLVLSRGAATAYVTIALPDAAGPTCAAHAMATLPGA